MQKSRRLENEAENDVINSQSEVYEDYRLFPEYAEKEEKEEIKE